MPSAEEINKTLQQFAPNKGLNVKKWGYNYDAQPNLQQQAQDAVQLEYGQAERGNAEAQRQAIAQYNRLVDEERTYGREVDPRLENIYGALQTSLGENQAANQETYTDAIGQIRGWYDQAYGANNQLNQEAMARITGDAERLGIEAGIPDGTKRLTEDFLYNQGQNRNAQAGRSANLAELAAKIEALDRNRVGAAGREGGQQRAMLANEIAQTIGDLGLTHYNELSELRAEQAGRMADRGAAERDVLRQFRQQDFENVNTARGNALQEFLARAGLGLQQSEFYQANYEADRNFNLARDELGLQRELGLGELELNRDQLTAEQQQAQRDDAIKWAQLDQDRRMWEAEFANANSPEAKARAQAELNRIRAETDALRAESGKAPQYPPGELGFQQYVKDNKVRALDAENARKIIDAARRKGDPNFAYDMLEAGTKNPSNFMDRYGFAWNPAHTQTLRTLVSIYYTGTGGGG